MPEALQEKDKIEKNKSSSPYHLSKAENEFINRFKHATQRNNSYNMII